MVTLLDAPELFVTLSSKNFVSSSRDCTILDADGAEVATAADTSGGSGRLVRTLLGSGRARYTWSVRDPDGNRLLEVVKPRTSVRGPSPEVSFADGSLLGTAVPGKGMSTTTPARFEGPDGTVFGELVPALGERRSQPVLMYRVREEDGAEVGEIALQTEGDWGFHLTFRDDADLSVRALTVGWTLCLVQQRSTTSAP